MEVKDGEPNIWIFLKVRAPPFLEAFMNPDLNDVHHWLSYICRKQQTQQPTSSQTNEAPPFPGCVSGRRQVATACAALGAWQRALRLLEEAEEEKEASLACEVSATSGH